MTTHPEDVLNFWFEAGPSAWWKKDPEFDAEIRSRFGALHAALSAGEHADWLGTAQGTLAQVIVLDQFSRNMFRDTPAAFASDAQALKCAIDGIAAGWDQQLTGQQRAFLYMPFMHAEDPAMQVRSLQLFTDLKSPDQSEYALRHKVIIDRFGRYPHRNAILGRESTAEEIAFLTEPNSSF